MSRTIPMEWHNNVDPTRVLCLAIVTLGIVWDSAVTRRLAIVMLIIAIVCWPFFSFYTAANEPMAATFGIALVAAYVAAFAFLRARSACATARGAASTFTW